MEVEVFPFENDVSTFDVSTFLLIKVVRRCRTSSSAAVPMNGDVGSTVGIDRFAETGYVAEGTSVKIKIKKL